MTTDVAERELADPEPPVEQTEDAPQLTLDDAAAAEPEAAAAPEPDDRVSRLEAELTRLREQQEAQERRQREEQRKRQRQNGLAAEQQRRQQADEAEATELLSAQLSRLGLDPEAGSSVAKPILDRFVQKRIDQVQTGVLSDVGDAFSAAAAEALGLDHDITLSERGEGYAAKFEPFVKDFYERAQVAAEQKLKTEGWLSPADARKAIEAGVAAKLNGQQQGKQPLRQPEGEPAPTTDNTDQARIDRIVSGTQTPEDEDWYRTEGPGRHRGR